MKVRCYINEVKVRCYISDVKVRCYMSCEADRVQTAERIRILDDATISQIAAGEVIERPTSVVKELVENSLDAGASWIAVELRGGGRTEIVVQDDGRGILHDDLALALHRHGTSKLASASDLFSVRTLGFRGEGLASIAAAAASVEVISRPAGQNFGARIAARNGALGSVQRVAASPGTRVTVRELFAATPVRRDFLGSEKTEFSRASTFLARIALGWPAVAFALRHDGRDVWSLPAVSDPVDRLEMVFGRGSRGALQPLRTSPTIVIGIGGFTSRIGADRPNRHGQVLFVNGRLVRSPALSAAWSAGYAAKIMSGRYPYGVLMLSLPPGDVDVNVHPTKIEVRFVSAAAVFDMVRSAVAEALASQAGEATHSLSIQPAAMTLSNGTAAESLPAVSLLDGGTSATTAVSQTARALGQIDQTFIVISDPSGLLIVDQHAAHERIAYEALEAGTKTQPASAPLLFPRVIELRPDQMALLESFEADFAAMGAELERFGEDAYRIIALPTGYGERRFDLVAMLDDLVVEGNDRSRSTGESQKPWSGRAEESWNGRTTEEPWSGRINLTDDRLQQHRRRLLATVACHSVVRAHEPLSLQEQVTLYERLRTCRDPQTCPHGRPTMLRLDAVQLAKSFKRT